MVSDGTDKKGRNQDEEKTAKNHPIIDDVMGLYNEKYSYLRLDEEMAMAKRYGNNLSLIMLELGSFKKINNTAKTSDGYMTLMLTSDIINSCTRSDIDLAFRI